MVRFIRINPMFLLLLFALTALAGCVAEGPRLHETRRGQGRMAADTTLKPGEIRAEVLQVHPSKSEIQVRSDDNRTRVLEYDLARTRVTYNGREYSVENLEAGDIIAFQTIPRDSLLDTVRVLEPVQARATSSTDRRSSVPRRQVIEGRIERIDYDRGLFDVGTRDHGTVTVALPYNARSSEIDEFRRLSKGDHVRLEGEFVNRDNFQVAVISR